MDGKISRRLIEWGKNLLIAVLILSAIYLLGRSQLSSDLTNPAQKWFSGFLQLLPGAEEPSLPSTQERQHMPVRPVRIAVMNELGRYGVQYDSAKVDEVFMGAARLANLISDALAHAGAPKKVTLQELQRVLSLKQPGVYMDFLGAIPAEVLSSSLSGGPPATALTGDIRRLYLTISGTQEILLYYMNESDGMYYACQISAPSLRTPLIEATSVFDTTLGDVIFAFEQPEEYGDLSPLTLISRNGPPSPKIYTASNPVSLSNADEMGTLLTSLGYSQSSPNYTALDGIAFPEGGDMLRVGANGVVTYTASGTGEPRYPVTDEGGTATLTDAVDAAWRLVEPSVGALSGSSRQLYLAGIDETEAGIHLYFAYQLDGATVRVGQQGYAAKVTVNDSAITGYTLQLRAYVETGNTSLVLPEAQATGVVRAQGTWGGELLLNYLDQRGAEVTAGWVVNGTSH